jgi:hypothetical protein
LVYKNKKTKIYRTVILPVLLYRCETLFLIIRDKHRLRVLKNEMLRKIFWPMKKEITGHWRKLHNEQLHELYSPPIIIHVIKSGRMRWAGHVDHVGEEKGIQGIGGET